SIEGFLGLSPPFFQLNLIDITHQIRTSIGTASNCPKCINLLFYLFQVISHIHLLHLLITVT
ncbi:unnamed protein product, partial [Musa textilis]